MWPTSHQCGRGRVISITVKLYDDISWAKLMPPTAAAVHSTRPFSARTRASPPCLGARGRRARGELIPALPTGVTLAPSLVHEDAPEVAADRTADDKLCRPGPRRQDNGTASGVFAPHTAVGTGGRRVRRGLRLRLCQTLRGLCLRKDTLAAPMVELWKNQ
jgi:hypothetical protein